MRKNGSNKGKETCYCETAQQHPDESLNISHTFWDYTAANLLIEYVKDSSQFILVAEACEDGDSDVFAHTEITYCPFCGRYLGVGGEDDGFK